MDENNKNDNEINKIVKEDAASKNIDVSGSTIKVDQSDELNNMYLLARRAKNENNYENAHKYYELVLIKDPNSWEAIFYTVYYQSMKCKIAEIQSAAIRVTNCEETVLQLIKDNILEPTERKNAVLEVANQLISISNMLYTAALNHYNGLGSSIKYNYTQEMINNCFAARDIVYTFGNLVIVYFGDEYGKDIAVPCWTGGMIKHQGILNYLKDKETNKSIIMNYYSKVQKYDPSIPAPVFTTSNSGCYVATAIYGSYDCPQVWTLRRYRDYTLAKTWYGRAFIHTYYAISPTLVKWFGHTTWFKKIWKGKLDHMVKNLQEKGYESTAYVDRDW